MIVGKFTSVNIRDASIYLETDESKCILWILDKFEFYFLEDGKVPDWWAEDSQKHPMTVTFFSRES